MRALILPRVRVFATVTRRVGRGIAVVPTHRLPVGR